MGKMIARFLSILILASLLSTSFMAKSAASTGVGLSDPREITVTKTWDHGTNKQEDWPDSVTVKLMNGENVIESVTLEPDSSDPSKDWVGTFASVPRYDDKGETINYKVEEVPVDEYTTEITQQLEAGTFGPSNWSEKITPASSPKYNIGSSSIVLANHGNIYYVWTLVELNTTQKDKLRKMINDANLQGIGKSLGVNNTNFDFGLPAEFAAHGGTIKVKVNAGSREIHFSDPSTWSLFYYGNLDFTSDTMAEIQNTFIEPSVTDPPETDPPETDPPETNPPETTPPVVDPSPSPTPEIEIPEDETPLGPVSPSPSPSATPEVELEDDEVPKGSGTLPKTGEFPPVLFYGSGAVLTAFGAYLRRKFKKR